MAVTYLLLMLFGWVLPVSDLGHREYTIREAAQKRLAAWGYLAAPALAHEVARPHSPEAAERAELLLERLPSPPVVLAKLMVFNGHTNISDEVTAGLGPWVLTVLRARDEIPDSMDANWLHTGGMCEVGATPDGAVYYRAFATRVALDTAFNTRILRWYGFWSPEMWN